MSMKYVRRAVKTNRGLFAFQVRSSLSLWAFWKEIVSARHLYGKALESLGLCHRFFRQWRNISLFYQSGFCYLHALRPQFFSFCLPAYPSLKLHVLQICPLTYRWGLEPQLDTPTRRTVTLHLQNGGGGVLPEAHLVFQIALCELLPISRSVLLWELLEVFDQHMYQLPEQILSVEKSCLK